ncbi:MAG: type III-B CRISPR module RAMP protein Cmr4 [Desulfobulbaceae bacterium]|nr:type III-B CRISPR module RAMP protein Cmr4 [Desulfobulbaceae bacterium]
MNENNKRNNMVQKPIPKILTLQALTFLHPGTGQTTGVVDLPVQREVHTQFPMYASSGLKGSLRDKAGQLDWGAELTTIFGGDTKNQSAGCLTLTDGRILAFPVRSLQQVFFWVTCPMVLQRLVRDLQLFKIPVPGIEKLDAFGVEGDQVRLPESFGGEKVLVLEELALEVTKDAGVDALGKIIVKLTDEKAGFDPARLAVVTDDDFKYLVRYATQVSARIKLNEQKTTANGGNLWYEETLPPETILYALALCHKPRYSCETINDVEQVAVKLEELAEDRYLQIGGNETVGQGWCGFKVYKEGEGV